MSEISDLAKQLASELTPMLADLAKTAVAVEAAKLGPAAALVTAAVPPVIDAVDAYILKLLGNTMPANATVAPTDAESRLTALETHVAALTVATGNGTSAILGTAKVVAATPAPAPAAAA